MEKKREKEGKKERKKKREKLVYTIFYKREVTIFVATSFFKFPNKESSCFLQYYQIHLAVHVYM